MKKLSNRALGVALAIMLCVISVYGASALETDGCFNKFSDTIYDFSGFKTTSNGALDGSFDNGGYLFKHHSNTDAFNTVKGVTEDGKTALELAHGVGGGSAYIQPQTYNDKTNVFQKAHISFSIKITENDTDPFALTFREDGQESIGIVTFQKGKIKLFSQDAIDYNLNTWYEIDARVDLTSNWGYFKIRQQGETQWTEFERFYDKLTSPQNGNVYTCKSSFWIAWQYLAKTATNAKVYLTNLMQNTDEGTMRVALPSNFDTESADEWYRTWSSADNHVVDGIQVSNNQNLDSRNYWMLQNFGLGKATITNRDVDNDGDLECVISTAAQNGTHNMMKKLPYGTAGESTNRTHVFRFKMGIGAGDSERYFGLRDSTGAEFNLILMYSNRIKLAAGKNSFPSEAIISTTKENYLYDCEVIYDANAKLCIASVTDEEGKQFTSRVDLGTYNALAGPHFDHKGQGSGAASYDLYVDDFTWDTLPAAAAVESVGISWSDDTNASLDECVVITCSETLDQEKNVGNAGANPSASVEIIANDTSVQVSYTLSVVGNRLFVNLADLDPGVAYTVTVSGITTLRGDSLVVPVSTSFTTTTDQISATKPTKSGNTVSATISAPYANGKKAMLVIGVYDDSGRLTDVINTVGMAKREENTALEADVSAYTAAAELRAFVWSDYNTMQPYSEVSVFK